MYEIDAALTHAINGLAGQSSTLDLLMIWFSNVGVYLMVLAVVTQWWRGPDRAHIRHIVVAAGFSFLLGLGLNQLILFVVHRVRPYDGGVTNLLIERSADFSSPPTMRRRRSPLRRPFCSTPRDAPDLRSWSRHA